CLTHYMVYEYFNGETPPKSIIHHKNKNKIDNHPNNLRCRTKADHSREHTLRRHEEDKEYRKKVAAGLQRFNLSEEGRKIHSEALKRIHARTTKEDYIKRARSSKTFRSDITPASLETIRDDPEATNANTASIILGCGRNVVIRVLKDMKLSSWEEFLKSPRCNNHKIRAVIPVHLKQAVPVYDLEVDEHHNFALSSGIFVHNSKDVSDAVAGSCHKASLFPDPEATKISVMTF
ncbi:MAG: HNH endonuclease, partial [Patescibacteria group bacterium]